ncbi:type IV conjugative transfer system coupling protein TraD [Roseinatronobacter monicus]|uniref:Type IV conjugative transfer system coupling protein TraD n=2 Tax=Roseinatronobacter monicus TaxID=393481 RepID=A0A543K5L2_9RHOB|nr:type IV conjugative transfer system coupling protein TraD [Roseinatronobacter monicus]
MANSAKNRSTQFVRGGQTTQHWVRMATQVLRSSLFVTLAVFIVIYAALVYRNYEIKHVRETAATWVADFNIKLGRGDKIVSYLDHKNHRQVRTSSEIAEDPRLSALSQRYNDNAVRFAVIAGVLALLGFAVSLFVFIFVGNSLAQKEHVRGTRLIDRDDLVKWSKHKWKTYFKNFGRDAKTGPQYTIGGIPFPPNAVEAQTGIFGTVGVGKTNAMKELLKTIRANNGRAIIYDRMGSLVRDFYDPETDIIINPFDERSKIWSPFFEAKDPAAIAQLAEVLIPQRPGSNDPFWSQTARLVFEYAARSLIKRKTQTNAQLRRAIMTMSAQELSNLIAGTPGGHFFGEHVEKTSASIRANMIAELRFLEFLRDDGDPVSIKDWVISDKPGFVFLSGDAEHSAATRNIISACLEVAANALMTCEEQRDPSLWFFIDEVPTLNKLPFLTAKLAEIRQFGGAFVLGYQVFSQLEDIYGEKGAQTIAGNLNNRIVFNTPDARTAKLFSESLGFEDVIEHRENLSFGAHETRDGVNVVSQRVERPIVTASEIQSLPQFEAYIRFAYDSPTAQITFGPIDVEPCAEKFIKYTGTGFDLDSMDANAPVPEGEMQSIAQQNAPELLDTIKQENKRKFATWTPREQLTAFEEWWAEGRKLQFDPQQMKFVPQIDAEKDDYMLWEHYYRQRLHGNDMPSYVVLTYYAEDMMSNTPRPKNKPRVHIPKLREIRELAKRDIPACDDNAGAPPAFPSSDAEQTAAKQPKSQLKGAGDRADAAPELGGMRDMIQAAAPSK